jgi:phenylacetate 2-hydroxylase
VPAIYLDFGLDLGLQVLFHSSYLYSLALSLFKTMTIPIYVAGIAVLGFFLYKFLYGTDKPHIKGLPEVPGLPLFGSLYELGTNHAKVAQGWAKKYGPVFQVRMGNKVSLDSHM